MRVGDANRYIALYPEQFQQREVQHVQQHVQKDHTDVKSRDIVGQQAGAHIHSQIQRDQFVDPSKTAQGQSQALIDNSPKHLPKRGLKRSLPDGLERRDPSQGPLSSAFQRTPFGMNKDQTVSQQEMLSNARRRCCGPDCTCISCQLAKKQTIANGQHPSKPPPLPNLMQNTQAPLPNPQQPAGSNPFISPQSQSHSQNVSQNPAFFTPTLSDRPSPNFTAANDKTASMPNPSMSEPTLVDIQQNPFQIKTQAPAAQPLGPSAPLSDAVNLLNHNKTQAAPAPTQTTFSGQPHLDQAINTIRDALGANMDDLEVTHGDLDRVQNTLANLDPTDFNQVIDQLSDQDLSTWMNTLHGF